MLDIQAITEDQAKNVKVVQFGIKPKLARLILPSKIASILNIQTAELIFFMSKQTLMEIYREIGYFEQYSNTAQILLATLKQAIKQYSKDKTDEAFHITLRIEARLNVPKPLFERIVELAMECNRRDIVQFIQMKYREDQGKFIRLFYNVDAEDLVKLLAILFPFEEINEFLTHEKRRYVQITDVKTYNGFWDVIENSNDTYTLTDMFVEQDIEDCHIINLKDISQLLIVEMIEQLEYTSIFDYWLEKLPELGNQLIAECSEQKRAEQTNQTIEDNYSSTDSNFEAFRFTKKSKKNGGGQLPN